MLTGGLVLDKPEGITSHDLVVRVRRTTGERRCGHTGTLDPFATGVMVLCLGRATRLARFVASGAKSYLATIHFGYATDTYDRTGKAAGPSMGLPPALPELESVLDELSGAREQLPPPFSAKRIGGERSHRLARSGHEVPTTPVPIEIHDLRLLDFTPPRARITATVSSGTYLRSVAHDLGQKLGCGAHLEELRRTRVGSFELAEALTVQALSELAARDGLEEKLLSPAELLRDLPRVDLEREAVLRLVHGRQVEEHLWETPPGLQRGPIAACDVRGRLVGITELAPEKRVLNPLLVLLTPEEAHES